MKYWRKKGLGFALILYIFCLLFGREKVTCQNAVINLTSASYPALLGGSVTIQCNTQFMRPISVVWSYKLGSSIVGYIYLNNNYQGSTSTKFMVSIMDFSFTNVSSTLTIMNVQAQDALYTYTCSCNPYQDCVNQPFVFADGSISLITTTTSTTTTSTTTSTSTTTTSTSTTTTIPPTTTTSTTTSTPTLPPTTIQKPSLCLDGLYLTAQNVLVVLTLITIICATFLFHFSFQGSLVETFFMVLAVLLTIFCLIVGLIFWINPQFAGSLSLAPVIIITVPLFGCVILWILVLQYAIRLCLLNEIKTIVVMIICVDALLEGFSAALIISANVYCAGLSSFSELNGFNYTYLEMIGSIFMLVFAFVLLLIAGIVFYMKKSKHEEHILNSFKALVTQAPFSPASFGLFSHPSSAASLAKRPQVHELWFQHSASGSKKVFPMNPYDTQYDSPQPAQKPKKLTPLYSKKRSEINQIVDTSKLPKLHKEEDSLAREPKKTKKNKTRKVENNKSAEFRSSESAKESLDTLELSKTERAKSPEKIQNQEQHIEESVVSPQEPKNQFDLIWSTDILMPKIEENGSNLPTIGEEFTSNMKRAKSFLGGRIFRPDEPTSPKEMNLPSLELKKTLKSLNGIKSDDSAILLNSASSSSSMSNRFS